MCAQKSINSFNLREKIFKKTLKITNSFNLMKKYLKKNAQKYK